MKQLLLLAASSLLAGCATVVPMQTASVVPEGAWRVGGQLSAAGFCSLYDVTDCHDYTDGIPFPEMRADVRRGLAPGFDLGASLQLQPVAFSAAKPIGAGLALDGKYELVRSGPHVVSTGLLGSGAISGRIGLSPWWQAELAVPLFHGFRTREFEWVAGLNVSHRWVWTDSPGTSALSPLRTWRTGVSAGIFRRTPAGWSLQLTYLAQPAWPREGALLVQFGWFWQLTPEG